MVDEIPELLSCGLSVNRLRAEIALNGQPLTLTKTEFRLLTLLLDKDGAVLTRKQIIEAVQGPDYPVTERSIDVHIVSLRRKLGGHGRRIETVRGAGYRWRGEFE